jgi:16S rRNA G966 N2-methylase RsmD
VLGIPFLFFMSVFFATGMPLGAGFQPTPRKAISRAFKLCDPKGKVVYDLGAGFGRVLFEAASIGAPLCVGVEADPLKCWWIRREAKRKGIQGSIMAVRANLLHVDLSGADVVFVFLSPILMKRLKQKVLDEMKPGSVVISYDHQFKGWKPEIADVESKLYLYRVASF